VKIFVYEYRKHLKASPHLSNGLPALG
jgi:hypothetical protein